MKYNCSFIILFFFQVIFFPPNLFGFQKGDDLVKYEEGITKGKDFIFDTDNNLSSVHFSEAVAIARTNGWYDKEIIALLNLTDRKVITNNIDGIEISLKSIKSLLDQHRESFVEGEDWFRLDNAYQETFRLVLSFSKENNYEYLKNLLTRMEDLENISEKGEEENEALCRVFYELSYAYKENGNYQLSEEYIIKYQGTGGDSIMVFLMLGELSWELKEYDKAEGYYKNVLRISKSKGLEPFDEKFTNAYKGLIKSYISNDQLAEARENIDLCRQHLQGNSLNYPVTYDYLGKVELLSSNTDEAIMHFEKALNLQRQIFIIESQGFKFYKNYLNFVDVYLAQNEFDKALDTLQFTFSLLHENFKSKNHESNPDIGNLVYPLETLEVFIKKLNVLIAKHTNQTNDSHQVAEVGMLTAQAAISWMDSTFQNYTSSSDQQILVDHSYSIFDAAIYFARALDQDQKAFEFSERSRSRVLAQALKRKEPEILAEVNGKVSDQINKLKLKISFLEKKKKGSSSFDEGLIISKSIDSLKNKIANLVAEIRNDNPHLNFALTDAEEIEIETIQRKLKKDQVLLEFFVGEKMIYPFLIDKKNGMQLQEPVPFDLELKNAIAEIGENIYLDEKEDYLKNGHLIFQKLFKPIFPDKLPKRLIIVPDGDLGYVPFNILLTGEPKDSKSNNYNKLPYFFQETSISLEFSAAMRLSNRMPSQVSEFSEILAYAPEFKDTYTVNEITERSQDQLMPLMYTEDEVKYLEDAFGAETILSKQASKNHFLETAKLYSYLHLATHAKVDKLDPDLSYVAFSNTLSENPMADDDYKLNMAEIYALPLSAKMVVLSACETGIGKSLKGEGIISIARGFAHTGVSSIVTSLWSVSDSKTAELMEYFYSNLAKGQEKDEALQEAMKQYLLDHEKAKDWSPSMWAAFTVIGNTDPVDLESPCLCWMFCLFALIGILLLIGIYARLKK